MRRFTLLLLVLTFSFALHSRTFGQVYQNGDEMYTPLTTAVPFLLIAPDARGGSMASAGGATTPDAYSLFWNPAKYAFIDKDYGFAMSYVPWLRNIVNDIGLSSVVGFKRFGDKQAIAAQLRYFSMGEVQFTNDIGDDIGTVKPNEFAFDATYSRKFSKTIAGAVAGRFIYSNLIPQTSQTTSGTNAGISVAADIAVYGHHEVEVKGLTSSFLDWGVDISNIGSKMSYSSTSTDNSFIPTNLRIGVGYTMDLDAYNRISVNVDINKLLVPTPPIYEMDSNGYYVIDSVTGDKVILKGMNPDVSPIQGMIQSFYDAPNGFSEEMAEINFTIAAEYWYNKLFAVRAGYFYESPKKGDRQYFTVGAGLRYNVFGFDFSYLIPTGQNNPLQNTMYFTLLFNFNGPNKDSKGSN